MAYPSSREWHHNHYHRIIKSLGWSHDSYTQHKANFNSVANQYFCTPVEIPVRCRIDRIGVCFGTATDGGNVMFGVHDSDPATLLPDNRVCLTAAIAVAPLPIDIFTFATPTTTPTIEPGYYYIGFIADADWDPGVTGCRFSSAQIDFVGDNWNDEMAGVYGEAVGAFQVPDPMTPVVTWNNYISACALRVTVML